jgi:CheY-like chemotaxis protein
MNIPNSALENGSINMIAKEKVILLAEDNPDDVELTKRALKKANVANEVIVAKDGVEALDYLFGTGIHEGRNTKELPQVVLLDIKMPRMDGMEVLKKIRENKLTEFLPVVILTSSDEEADMLNGYKLGANSYVRKPVEFSEFSEAVGRLGLYWLLLNQQPSE